MKNRKLLLIVVILIGAALLLRPMFNRKGDKTITVGAKDFTEQYVLGSMISVLLSENGFNVTEQFGTGSTITREGLETGQTDLYAEYTGTAWAVYLNRADEVISDPKLLYDLVKAEDADRGIVWLAPAPMNNTFALAIRADDVGAYGNSLTSLAAYNNAHPGEVIFGMS